MVCQHVVRRQQVKRELTRWRLFRRDPIRNHARDGRWRLVDAAAMRQDQHHRTQRGAVGREPIEAVEAARLRERS